MADPVWVLMYNPTLDAYANVTLATFTEIYSAKGWQNVGPANPGAVEQGPQGVTVARLVNTSATVNREDDVIIVDATAGDIILTLGSIPLGLAPARLTVVRSDASAHDVTIVPTGTGSPTINGTTNYQLEQSREGVQLVHDTVKHWYATLTTGTRDPIGTGVTATKTGGATITDATALEFGDGLTLADGGGGHAVVEAEVTATELSGAIDAHSADANAHAGKLLPFPDAEDAVDGVEPVIRVDIDPDNPTADPVIRVEFQPGVSDARVTAVEDRVGDLESRPSGGIFTAPDQFYSGPVGSTIPRGLIPVSDGNTQPGILWLKRQVLLDNDKWDNFVNGSGGRDPIGIVTTSLPAGTKLQAYNAMLQFAGGSLPALWSMIGTPVAGTIFRTVDETHVGCAAVRSTDVVSIAGHTINKWDQVQIFGVSGTDLVDRGWYYARDIVAATSIKLAAVKGGAAVNIGGTADDSLTVVCPGGQLSGEPTAAGTPSLDFVVTGAMDWSATVTSLVQNIADTGTALAVAWPANLPDCTLHQPYDLDVIGSYVTGGTGPYTLDAGATANLPNHAIKVNQPSAGHIGSQPGTDPATDAWAGTTIPVHVRVTDSLGAQVTTPNANLKFIASSAALQITNASVPSGKVGDAYAGFTMAASGGSGTGYVFSIDSGWGTNGDASHLVGGVTFSSGGVASTGVIGSGNDGTFSVRFKVVDSSGAIAYKTLTFVVSPAGAALTFTPPTRITPTVNAAFSLALAGFVAGGTGPYTYSHNTSGGSPTMPVHGLDVNTSTGLLGATNVNGNANDTGTVSVTVTDSLGAHATAAIGYTLMSATAWATEIDIAAATTGITLDTTSSPTAGTGTATGAQARTNVTKVNAALSTLGGATQPARIKCSVGTVVAPVTVWLSRASSSGGYINNGSSAHPACKQWDLPNVIFKLMPNEPMSDEGDAAAMIYVENCSNGKLNIWYDMNSAHQTQSATTTRTPGAGSNRYGFYGDGMLLIDSDNVTINAVVRNIRGVVGANFTPRKAAGTIASGTNITGMSGITAGDDGRIVWQAGVTPAGTVFHTVDKPGGGIYNDRGTLSKACTNGAANLQMGIPAKECFDLETRRGRGGGFYEVDMQTLDGTTDHASGCVFQFMRDSATDPSAIVQVHGYFKNLRHAISMHCGGHVQVMPGTWIENAGHGIQCEAGDWANSTLGQTGTRQSQQMIVGDPTGTDTTPVTTKNCTIGLQSNGNGHRYAAGGNDQVDGVVKIEAYYHSSISDVDTVWCGNGIRNVDGIYLHHQYVEAPSGSIVNAQSAAWAAKVHVKDSSTVHSLGGKPKVKGYSGAAVGDLAEGDWATV